MTPTIKPGIKTSEFWYGMLNFLVGNFVIWGILTTEQASALVEAVAAVVGGLMVILPTVYYIYTRFILKKEVAFIVGGTPQVVPPSEAAGNPVPPTATPESVYPTTDSTTPVQVQ